MPILIIFSVKFLKYIFLLFGIPFNICFGIYLIFYIF